MVAVPPDPIPSAEARVSTPVDENEDVAVAPKYALYADAIVDDAFVNCCRPVQVFAFAKLREAITSPVVGEIVRVLSEFETDETAPPPPPLDRHTPPIAKHPLEILNPTFDVVVADEFDIAKSLTVVVPTDDIHSAGMVDVANKSVEVAR